MADFSSNMKDQDEMVAIKEARNNSQKFRNIFVFNSQWLLPSSWPK